MRKIYITLVVLLIAMIGMAYLYFSNLQTENSANNLSLNAAAADASIVFSFENDKSFYDILSGQDLLQNILGEKKSSQLKNLKDAFLTKEINSAMLNQKVYIAILPGVKDSIDFLVTTQLKENIDQLNLLKEIQQKVKASKIDEIYKLTFPDTSFVYLGIKDKLLTISNSDIAIRKSIQAQFQDTSPFANYISKNSTHTKNTLANLFFNFNRASGLLKNFLTVNLVGELSVFNNQNTFASLTYNYSTEKLLFNGYTQINDEKNYYHLFTANVEQKITINSILPDKTANYIYYSFSNYASFRKSLVNWFSKNGESEKISSLFKKIDETYRINLEEDFSKFINSQFITFQLNSGEKFGAIDLNNGDKVNQLLLDLSAEYAPNIRIFKDSNIPYSLFGEPFKKFERPFFTVIDNYLVMANNASSIQVFLNSYNNSKLLVNSTDYIRFRDQISSSATICFYVNNKNSNDIFGRNLKAPYFKHYQSSNGLKEFDAFCYQLSGDKGKFLTNILVYKKLAETTNLDTLKSNP
jgi:hypothetical protein